MKSPSLDKLEVMRRQRTQSGRLTEAEVGRIKWLLGHGSGPRTHTVRELAKVYQMSFAAIKAIDREESWGWVQAQAPEVQVTDDAGMSAAAARSLERFKALMGMTDEWAGPPPMPQIYEKEVVPQYDGQRPVVEDHGVISPGLMRLEEELNKGKPSEELSEELDKFIGEAK